MENQIIKLEGIQRIVYKEGKVHILYEDGTKMIANSEEVEFHKGWVNDRTEPIIDHCI